MLLNRSRGELGGKPFAQHCSCLACFRCSVGSTVAAFLGTIFVCEVCLNRTGTSPALNRQGGNIRVAALYAVVFLLPKWTSLLHRSLWSRVLALPTLSGPMIFQLQSQTCHKFVPLRATWYWARLLLPNSSYKMNMPRWSPSDKLISSKIKMQSSKLRATSFQQVALRDFENSGGSARSGQKTFKKI